MKAYIRDFSLGIVLAVISAALFFYFGQKQGLETFELRKNLKPILGVSNQEKRFPVFLKIPSIDVNTSIEYVGLTSKGDMEIPSSTNNAGWFELGPRPGEIGSAVIAGHFDGGNGKMGIFSNLFKLKPGDMLYTQDINGESTAFIVRETRIYNPGYAEEVFSSSGGAHLNLITCDGIWDDGKKSYTKRLVVFADIVGQ